MVVSSLMNLNDEVWGENEEILLPEQITYFGINDTDQFEEELINELNINYIGRDEILKKSNPRDDSRKYSFICKLRRRCN